MSVAHASRGIFTYKSRRAGDTADKFVSDVLPRRNKLGVLSAALLLALSAAAQDAQDENDPSTLDEITVTAQRFEQATASLTRSQ